MGITQTQVYAQCFNCDVNTKAFSIGTGIATGNNSFAGGSQSSATVDNSFVFGQSSMVTGLRGIALGNQAKVSLTDGIAIGNFAISNALNSYVFGQNLSSTAANSITIGLGSSSSNLLSNTKAGSLMFGVTHKPSLTILKPANADVGYLGIGTDTPEEMVHLQGKMVIESTETTQSGLQFRHKDTRGLPPGDPQAYTPQYFWDIYSDTQGLKINNVDKKNGTINQRMIITGNGSVGIGVAIPKVKLEIGGVVKATGANITGTVNADELNAKIVKVEDILLAQEIKVSLKQNWPDYVFNKNYNLLPLNEVEQFIAENQHLPNVPSAAEVEANGVNVGEMNATLLKKVEELTLYIIDLQKQIDELKSSKS